MNKLGSIFFALVVVGCGASSGLPTPEPVPQIEPPPAEAATTEPAVEAMPPPPAAAARTSYGGVDLDTVRAGRFDNGKMWTFEYPPLDYLQETYGFAPDSSWLERARLGALRLPNCSAAFVSPNGLVMTNHHCARESVTQVNRPGEELLDDGFYAPSLDEERAVDDFHADNLIAIVDVSAEMDVALRGG